MHIIKDKGEVKKIEKIKEMEDFIQKHLQSEEGKELEDFRQKQLQKEKKLNEKYGIDYHKSSVSDFCLHYLPPEEQKELQELAYKESLLLSLYPPTRRGVWIKFFKEEIEGRRLLELRSKIQRAMTAEDWEWAEKQWQEQYEKKLRAEIEFMYWRSARIEKLRAEVKRRRKLALEKSKITNHSPR